MKIKLITLNLFQGGLYFKNIKNFLEKEKPDILCLQEVFDSHDKSAKENLRSIDILKRLLPSYYYHFAPELLSVNNGIEAPLGNAIFSKFLITKTNTIFYDIPYGKYNAYLKNDNKYDPSMEPKNLEYVQVDLGKASINIFNTHGIWGQHGNDTKRRLQMGQVIINQIKGKENVILAGDFNLFPNTQTVKNIEKHLKNVFANELKTTFNIKLKLQPGNYGRAVVDMIFLSKNIRILKKYCPDVNVSDHFPLICNIELS
ncbi:MAG: endonuclease/exonuclease/phosphatase family protein [Candidatus Levybacteria bacterium]|nr:endonuclease/exonuclease/phosphatase family protein [Candidatus Levybacteria bacterium]